MQVDTHVYGSWGGYRTLFASQGIDAGDLPLEREVLTERDHYNEYVMTRLRTMWGISMEEVRERFGLNYYDYLMEQAETFVRNDLLALQDEQLLVTPKGKFLSDGIASDLFKIL